MKLTLKKKQGIGKSFQRTNMLKLNANITATVILLYEQLASENCTHLLAPET